MARKQVDAGKDAFYLCCTFFCCIRTVYYKNTCSMNTYVLLPIENKDKKSQLLSNIFIELRATEHGFHGILVLIISILVQTYVALLAYNSH